jgi:hypothetical protein
MYKSSLSEAEEEEDTSDTLMVTSVSAGLGYILIISETDNFDLTVSGIIWPLFYMQLGAGGPIVFIFDFNLVAETPQLFLALT